MKRILQMDPIEKAKRKARARDRFIWSKGDLVEVTRPPVKTKKGLVSTDIADDIVDDIVDEIRRKDEDDEE